MFSLFLWLGGRLMPMGLSGLCVGACVAVCWGEGAIMRLVGAEGRVLRLWALWGLLGMGAGVALGFRLGERSLWGLALGLSRMVGGFGVFLLRAGEWDGGKRGALGKEGMGAFWEMGRSIMGAGGRGGGVPGVGRSFLGFPFLWGVSSGGWGASLAFPVGRLSLGVSFLWAFRFWRGFPCFF